MKESTNVVKGAAKIVRDSIIEDKVLYDALVASIESALKEVPAGTGLYDVAQAVADRIIGREEEWLIFLKLF